MKAVNAVTTTWPGLRVDRPTFSAVAESELDAVHRYLLFLTGNRTVAEDLTGETFEKAFRIWRRFDPRRGTPRAWLCGIARTTAPFSTRPAKRPKPEPLKCSPTSLMSKGLRRSGLSLPYFSSASLYGMRGYSPAGVTVRPSANSWKTPDNTGSIAFHTKLGFEIEAEVEGYDGPDGSRVLLRRAL